MVSSTMIMRLSGGHGQGDDRVPEPGTGKVGGRTDRVPAAVLALAGERAHLIAHRRGDLWQAFLSQ